ncbi:hypothetical protein EsH8_III_001386 [Colletotrichum jinshuiense]
MAPNNTLDLSTPAINLQNLVAELDAAIDEQSVAHQKAAAADEKVAVLRAKLTAGFAAKAAVKRTCDEAELDDVQEEQQQPPSKAPRSLVIRPKPQPASGLTTTNNSTAASQVNPGQASSGHKNHRRDPLRAETAILQIGDA